MKQYVGRRTEAGVLVTVREGGRDRELDPRFDLRRHSPSGFEVGYNGSGPAQLALAICADALGDDEAALSSYQQFKRKVISGITGDHFTIDAARVVEICAAHMSSRDRDVGGEG